MLMKYPLFISFSKVFEWVTGLDHRKTILKLGLILALCINNNTKCGLSLFANLKIVIPWFGSDPDSSTRLSKTSTPIFNWWRIQRNFLNISAIVSNVLYKVNIQLFSIFISEGLV